MAGSSLIAAQLLARTKLCRVDPVVDSAGQTVAFTKRRLRSSSALLWLSHRVPSFSPHVRGLDTGEWIAWERQAWKCLHGREVTALADGLTLPALPGSTLSTVLIDTRELEQKFALFSAALAALRCAHRPSVRWPDGSEHRFSHSDAHVGNVLCEAQAAYWFDFETLHDCAQSSAWRHADDVRALVYSAAAHLSAETWPELSRRTADGIGDESVCDELRKLATQIKVAPHLLHLSQAPMEIDRQRTFTDVLLSALAE